MREGSRTTGTSLATRCRFDACTLEVVVGPLLPRRTLIALLLSPGPLKSAMHLISLLTLLIFFAGAAAAAGSDSLAEEEEQEELEEEEEVASPSTRFSLIGSSTSISCSSHSTWSLPW